MDMISWFKPLENAMDAAAIRQQITSNNVANAASIGYQAQGVAFEDEFKKALAAKDDDLSIRPVSMDESEDASAFMGSSDDPTSSVRPKVINTGMPVDMNKEMALLAKNQIHYNMLVDKASGVFSAINGIFDVVGR